MASVTVFPQGRIDEEYLKILCALFDTVHIAMPWAMDPTEAMQKAARFGLLEIHHPSEYVRFDTRLKAIVRDYENLANWYGQGKLSSFLKAAGMEDQGQARWKISETIKKMGTPQDSGPDPKALYYQILLHLYQKTEESTRKAEMDLEALEISGSPLAEALGEEPPLDHGRKSSRENAIRIPISDSLIEQVIRAWTELFPIVLDNTRILITLRPEVFSYVTSLVEDLANPNIVSARKLQVTHLILPSCAGISWSVLGTEQISELRQKIGHLLALNSEAPFETIHHRLAQDYTFISQYLKEAFCLDEVKTYRLSICPLPQIRPKDKESLGLVGTLSDKLMIGLGI